MKGITKLTGIGIMATVLVAITISFAFVLAIAGTFTVTVVNIVTNQTINNYNTEATISILNCSNSTQILNSSITTNGIVNMGYDTAWNFSIRVSATNFVNLNDTNSDACYTGAITSVLEEIYPTGIISINVTTKDVQNQRPIPNSEINIWSINSPTDNTTINYNYNNNYRCVSNLCKTDANGSIMLFAFWSELIKSNYTVYISSNEYVNTNVTADTSNMNEGVNLNLDVIELTGRGRIEGYVKDLYNNEPITGATVSIINYTVIGEGSQIGFDSTYYYNTTTSSSGYYNINFPTDLIGATTIYSLKIVNNNYTTRIDDNNGIGYVGSRNINSTMTGIINITGRVLDSSNNISLSNATVTITETGINPPFTYTIYTNSSGGFYIGIKNMTNYTLSITKTGYNDYSSNQTGSTNPNDLGNITLLGNSVITGRILDRYNDSNSNPIALISTVTITQGAMTYATTSNATGHFILRITDISTYSIVVSKAGYFSYINDSLTAVNGQTTNIGDLLIAGRTELSGNVKDICEQSADCEFYGSMGNVDVYANITNGDTYKVTTDSDGEYNMNISSNSVEFFMKYEHGDYRILTDTLPGRNISSSGLKDLGTAYMSGNTTISGYVVDEYSPTGTNLFVGNTNLRIRYANNNTDLYLINTNTSGYFSNSLGVSGDYRIIVSKSGYETATHDNNGDYYKRWESVTFDPSYLRLNGSTVVQGIVFDKFSRQSVNNAIVKIYKLGEETETYRLSVNGSFLFKVDGTITYILSADGTGYPEESRNNGGLGFTSNLTENITLNASFQVIASDVENQWKIPNAKINLYHYYNQTSYGKSINETLVNVTVTCPGINPLNIPITLNKTACLWYQNASNLNICDRTQNTSTGTTLFRTVASGTYNVTVNGSTVGCGVLNTTITLTTNLTGITNYYTYSLGNTSAIVKAIDPRGVAVANANISSVTNTSVVCTTNSSGICILNLMPGYLQNVTVVHANYFQTNKTYNITPGEINNLTDNPITLNPHPGNLTLNVSNTSGIVLESISVSVSNSTYNQTNVTNSSGLVSFVELTSFFNITINGTLQGYNHTNITNRYITPDAITILNITLDENTYLITILDAQGLAVNVSNVTLSNLTTNTTASDAAGNPLTMLTNASGRIFFTRLIPNEYNLTINATGYNGLYTELVNVTIGANTKTITLNDTEAPAWSNVSIGNTTTNEGLAAIFENETLTVSAIWTDNARLSLGRLQLLYPGSSGWENYSERTMTGKSLTWNATIANDFINAHAGQNITWKMTVRDLAGNWNASMPGQNFSIVDNENPNITISVTPSTPTGSDVVVYSVNATDNVNVTEIKIYVDYVEVINCTGSNISRCSYQSPVPYGTGTKHYYYATAKDNQGNEGRDPEDADNLTTKSTTLTTSRRGTAAAFHGANNHIYIFGGYNGTIYYRDIFEYNPAVDAISTAGLLPWTREMAAAAYDNDTQNVSIFGGFNGTDYSADIIMFDADGGNNSANLSTILPAAIGGSAAAFIPDTGNMTIFGGFNNATNYSNQTLDFDPDDTNYGLSTDDELSGPRYLAAAAVDTSLNGDDVYLFGGYNESGDLNETVLYDQDQSVGSRVSIKSAALPNPMRGASAVYYPPNDNVYVFGGCNGGNTTSPLYSYKTILEYNISADSITTKSKTLPSERCLTSAVYNSVNNTILIFGGYNNESYFNTIVEYTPVTSKNFVVKSPTAQATLNVSVRDEDGSAIPNATITLNDATYTETKNTSTAGETWFAPTNDAGEYTLTTVGQSVGYGNNATNLNLTAGENSIIITLNITTLVVNITTNESAVVGNANVSLRDSSGIIVLDATGSEVSRNTSNSGATKGTVEFTRLIPCTNCNLTVSKAGVTPSSNWTTVTITAGQNDTVNLDPTVDSYYIGYVNETIILLLNVTNSTGQAIQYANISAYEYETTIVHRANLTDSNGLSSLNVVSGTYNVTIDGEQAGHNFLDFLVRIGKLVFANGTTRSTGEIEITVDGQPGISHTVPGDGYYVKIEAVGYRSYDRLDDELILKGTYFDNVADSNPDVNNTFRINLTGTSMINGTIEDSQCQDYDTVAGCRYLNRANVSIKFHGGVDQGTTRYAKLTDQNGTYSIYVSPYTSTSEFDSPINTTYDILISRSGYSSYDTKYNGYGQGINILNSTNTTFDIGMSGASTASGYVYVINSSNPINNANVSFINVSNNHTFYIKKTNADGFFTIPISSDYNFILNVRAIGYVNKTLSDSFNGTRGFSFNLYPASHGGILFRIKGELNESIQGANISMVGPMSYNLSPTDSTGESVLVTLLNYNYNTTINGTDVGYGVNNTVISVEEGAQSTINITLNSTRLNITLASNGEGAVNGMTVTVNSTDTTYAETSTTDENGSVVFRKVLLGTYNITFTGNETEIYQYNATINTTVNSAGSVSNVNLTLNETRAELRICASNATIDINNRRTGQSYQNSTNNNGIILFRAIPYGNYTVYVNETAFYDSGCTPRNGSVAEVVFGGNENTSNSINLSNNITISFNITSNSTGAGISSINVTVYSNSSVASDAVNSQPFTVMTSSGIAEFRKAFPSTYTNGSYRSYRYIIDANVTGYGIWNRSLTVGLTGVNITENIEPLTSTIFVRDANGNVLSSGVNVTLMSGSSIAQNSSGFNLTATGVTDNVTFSNLRVGNHTVVINSSTYFNRLNDTGIWMNGSRNLSFTLSERNLVIRLYDYKYTYAASKVLITDNTLTVSIQNSTGIVTNTSGNQLLGTTSTGTITFTGIYDGDYSVSAGGTLYQTTIGTVNTQTDNYIVNVYMMKDETGYFNVTTSPGSIGLGLRCNTTNKDSRASNSAGNAILGVNITECNNSLYIDGSRSGYNSNTIGPYNISQQYTVENVSITLSGISIPSTPGGVTSGPSIFPSSCAEDWKCGNWGLCTEGNQSRTCIDDNNCSTTNDRPDLRRACRAEISLEISEKDISSGECSLASLKIKNIGNVNILNLKLLRDVLSDCCVISSSDIIYKLMPQEVKDLSLQICSVREATKDEYYHTYTITSNLATKSGTMKINVIKDYTEVLLAQITDIEKELEGLETSSQNRKSITETLIGARELAIGKKYSKAEMEISDAKTQIKKITEAKAFGIELWWLLLPIVLMGIAGFYFLFRRMGMGPRYKVSAPRTYPAYPAMNRKDILLRDIEKIGQRLGSVDINRLEKKELYYYNKAKDLMGDIKRHIETDNFMAAKNALIDLEGHIKVLEYKMNPGFE